MQKKQSNKENNNQRKDNTSSSPLKGESIDSINEANHKEVTAPINPPNDNAVDNKHFEESKVEGSLLPTLNSDKGKP